MTLPVAGRVGPGFFADGQHGRAPELPGLLIADVENLAGRIPHRVVRPGRQLVLATVPRPGVTRARFRDLKPEAWVGNHVDPRGRRPLTLAEGRDVLASVVGKSAEAVEKLEIGTARWQTGRRRLGPAAGRSRSGDGKLRLPR